MLRKPQSNRPRGAALNPKLLVILRERVAAGYYDRPEVIDALARILSRSG
ncbi:MAG TPA: hypothetical protein VFO66_07615 [Gemmatimonadaceae bacterium]|nr:hypothetical protein [Gemmatimonadaceae bacterium]